MRRRELPQALAAHREALAACRRCALGDDAVVLEALRAAQATDEPND